MCTVCPGQINADPVVQLPSAVNTKGKWAGRRRPTYNPRLNPLAARSEAAAKISELSDQKSSYYKAKFELRRLEHEQRMTNLRLEEQLLRQKIEGRGKIDEE